jgi:hypothetical protein
MAELAAVIEALMTAYGDFAAVMDSHFIAASGQSGIWGSAEGSGTLWGHAVRNAEKQQGDRKS